LYGSFARSATHVLAPGPFFIVPGATKPCPEAVIAELSATTAATATTATSF
jgi:hypothetical protein